MLSVYKFFSIKSWNPGSKQLEVGSPAVTKHVIIYCIEPLDSLLTMTYSVQGYHWLLVLVVGKSRKGKRKDKKSRAAKEFVEDKDEPSKEEVYHISSEDEDGSKGMKSKDIFIRLTNAFLCLLTIAVLWCYFTSALLKTPDRRTQFSVSFL